MAASRLNFLVETIWTSNQYVSGPNKTAWSQELYVSPGIRWAYNLRSGLQIVPGIGIPVGIGPSGGQREHPFGFAHSRANGSGVKE